MKRRRRRGEEEENRRRGERGKERKENGGMEILKLVQLKHYYHRRLHPVLCVLLVVHPVAWWEGTLAVEEGRHKQ